MDLGFRAQDLFWVWFSGFRKLFSGRRARAGKLGEYVSPSFHGAARAYTGAGTRGKWTNKFFFNPWILQISL